MLPRRAFIDYAALPHFDLKTYQLFISALVRLSLGNSHHIGLQFGVQKFEQIAAADGVDQDRAVSDRPPHKGHAIAMAADVQANHPRAKGLEQDLGVGRVVAEVGNDEGVMVVLAINRRRRIGTRTAIKPLRQLRGLQNAE